MQSFTFADSVTSSCGNLLWWLRFAADCVSHTKNKKKRSDYTVIKIDFAWVAFVLILFYFFTCKKIRVYLKLLQKSSIWKHEYLKKKSTCNNSEANSNNIRCDRLDVDYHKTLQKLNVFTQSLSLKWLSWRKLSLREELILCNYFWRGDKWETH